MCKRIGSPNIRVHLDVYHMNIEELDIGQAILETGDYLDYFHTGDSHRGYLGSGSIDLASVFGSHLGVQNTPPSDHFFESGGSEPEPSVRLGRPILGCGVRGNRRPFCDLGDGSAAVSASLQAAFSMP